MALWPIPEQVQHQLTLMISTAVLEHVEGLECAEYGTAVLDRHRNLDLCQGSTQVRRHVVQAFLLVAVQATAFRRQPHKERFQVGLHLRVGICLHQQRSRRVPAPDRQ